MSKLTIEQIVKTVRQVPSPSTVVIEILASFEKENLDTASLVKKIGQDQGLTARVLRVANSPFYGMSSKVGSVGEAMVVLGFHNVRSLVAAAGIINQFPVTEGNSLDRLAFWQHSIGSAVCAQGLAKTTGKDQALAFTAGLLHDVGRLVLDAYFHDESSAIMAYSAAQDVTLSEAEQAQIGFDHAVIGYELVKQWKFPVPIQQAIRNHLQPERDRAVLTDLVHVANVLCHALDFGNAGYKMVPPLSSGSWTRLGLDWDAMPLLLAEIERQYDGAHMLLSE